MLIKTIGKVKVLPLFENTKFSKLAVAWRLAVVLPAVVALKVYREIFCTAQITIKTGPTGDQVGVSRRDSKGDDAQSDGAGEKGR